MGCREAGNRLNQNSSDQSMYLHVRQHKEHTQEVQQVSNKHTEEYLMPYLITYAHPEAKTRR